MKEASKNKAKIQNKTTIAKWTGAAFFSVCIVGILCFLAWLFFAMLDTFLGEENTFGNITVTPYGYNRSDFFHQRFDSLEIKGVSFYIKLKQPEFKLSRRDSLFFKVKASDAEIVITKDTSTDDSSSIEIPEIPNASLFFRTGIEVTHAKVSVKDIGFWEASKITLTNTSKKELSLKANEISGTNLPKPLSLTATASWNAKDVQINANTVSDKDTITITATAPRKSPANVQVSSNIQMENPMELLPAYPSEAPKISNLKIKAKVHNDNAKPLRYTTEIEADMKERYPLKKMHVSLKATGNPETMQFKIRATSEDGGSIDLEGVGTKDLNGEVRGNVKNMNGTFGPEEMPMDMQIHSAKKIGNVLYASVTTKAGSNVNATITLFPKFFIDYTGDIANDEPWAIKWTHGNLTLKDRPQVIGEFSDGEMRASVRIGKVENAYFMAADSLKTHLALTLQGIKFDKGIIYGKRETFDFKGEVIWNDIEPHTSWEVHAKDGAFAKARIIFEGPEIDAFADNVLISSIPFAKEYLPSWLDAKATGTYKHNFDIDTAYAEFSLDANAQMYHTLGDFSLRLRQDTVTLEHAEVRHENNSIQLQASILLPSKESEEKSLPVEVLSAWVSTRSFSIPLSLLPLGDSTFSAGEFSGDLSYTDSHGLHGNIEFDSLTFRNIPKEVFSIKQMNLFAERAKAELDAYLEIGNGVWDGRTQIVLDQILNEKKHFSFAHITNNGGHILGDGFFDSEIKANVSMDGFWLLPGGAGELKKSDLRVSIESELSRGLNGIKASFYADSIIYAPLTIDYEIPIRLNGRIEDKVIHIDSAFTDNNLGESITANMSYSIEKLMLQELNVSSESYSLNFGAHKLSFKDFNATLFETDNEMLIHASVPQMLYSFNSETVGDISAKAHSDLQYHLPKRKSFNTRLANSIEGNVFIDKLIYEKEIDVEISPSTITKQWNSLQNMLANWRRKTEVQKKEISKTNSTNLNIRIQESKADSVLIDASFAKFPFTVDLNLQGNISRPLLRGEIANAGEGFVGFKGLYEFNLQTFLVSFAGVPWQQGVMDISFSQDLPYCTESSYTQNETCPVSIGVSGTVTAPRVTPSSYCGNESSTAAIYYNILLGCVADDSDSENMDWNKLAGSAIGKVISSTANKTLGGNYIGNIDMKMRIFSNTETFEEDSSYVKIPVSLDNFVKNLSLVFGYTQDQSINPTYDHAFEFGIYYKLPFFKEEEYIHSDHLNPELSIGAMLVSKQYYVNGSQENENQLEKNVGLNYRYKFWSQCLFGIGNCNDYENTKSSEEVQK